MRLRLTHDNILYINIISLLSIWNYGIFLITHFF